MIRKPLQLPSHAERLLLRLADAAFDRRPRPVPEPARLQNCRIISHRGEHGRHQALENTLAAFDQAVRAGVWGLELDIRWTRDLEPVVFHDADLLRLYGRRDEIAAFSLNSLNRQFPAIACLSEVVSRWGGKVHLMIEVKQQPWPEPRVQAQRLWEALHRLEAVRDYHLLALQPEILQAFSSVPSAAKIAVADGWPAAHSRWVRRNHWGGVCGHYLLLTQAMTRDHHEIGQKVGTGYVRSRYCLFRELNRGVDWIFSNNAVELQQILAAIPTRPQ